MMNLKGNINYINYILFISAVLFLPFTFAISSEQSEIIELAKKDYESKLNVYESKISYCRGLRNSNIITDTNKKILESLGLSTKELKKAVYVIYQIQSNKCDNKELGSFLISRALYIGTLKQYQLKDDDIYTDDDLFVTTNYYKSRLDYLKLPYKIRETIEGIEQLKKPFKLKM